MSIERGALLSHEQPSTTQIGAHVRIQHLREVHRRTHPGSEDRKNSTESNRSVELEGRYSTSAFRFIFVIEMELSQLTQAALALSDALERDINAEHAKFCRSDNTNGSGHSGLSDE